MNKGKLSCLLGIEQNRIHLEYFWTAHHSWEVRLFSHHFLKREEERIPGILSPRCFRCRGAV